MLIARRSLTVLAFLMLASISIAAQEKAARIDDLIKLYNTFGQFNGSILVAENGRVVYKKGHGFANMEWKVPAEPDTKYRIGSVTKQFTAALILQLVEQGKIALDGKITDYLPEYRKDTGDRITIHQLLNHTSGIPSYTGMPNFIRDVSRNDFAPAEFVKKYASGDLEFEPGSKFAYNNSAYFILGAIIEKVTGKPYEQAVKENIFVPLGMKNSGYDRSNVIIEKRAAGYTRNGQSYVNAQYLDMSIPYAAGSLYSTVEDLYLWDQALYSEKIISAKSKELMFKPGLENYGYGLGTGEVILSDKKTKIPTLSHNGGIPGFNSEFVRVPNDKHLIVILDNTQQGQYHRPMYTGILNILYGQSADAPKRSIAEIMMAAIAERGVEAAIKQYRDLKAANSAEYNFAEGELNTAGYQLLRSGNTNEAGEIFKLNVEMFPNSANPHDSLAEWYAAAGQKDLAIKSYKRALEIDPKFPSALAALKVLEAPTVAVDPKAYEAYVGRYQLTPAVILTVTTANGKLFGQPTGQALRELEPLSATRFVVRAVNAEIAFVKDASGKAGELILNQGGREVTAKRLP